MFAIDFVGWNGSAIYQMTHVRPLLDIYIISLAIIKFRSANVTCRSLTHATSPVINRVGHPGKANEVALFVALMKDGSTLIARRPKTEYLPIILLSPNIRVGSTLRTQIVLSALISTPSVLRNASAMLSLSNNNISRNAGSLFH